MPAPRTQAAPEIKWVEIPILIHGITPEPDPRSHVDSYRALMSRVNAALVRHNKVPLLTNRIDIEWGWQSGQSTDNDRYLAEVEQRINLRVERALRVTRDFTLNPLRLAYGAVRGFLLFGAGDLFYYISADGEKALRTHIFGSIAQKIRQIVQGPNIGVSLTLFAHSAGSVIAHDLLFHLFGKEDRDAHLSEDKSIIYDMDLLRSLRRAGSLRLRRFYTFGSPISSLTLRANKLIEKILGGELLDPHDIGLRPADGLSNPRWVNFWDQDDIVSSPVSFLYANDDAVIEDKYINLGSFFPSVHNAYWSSNQMAAYIAKTF